MNKQEICMKEKRIWVVVQLKDEWRHPSDGGPIFEIQGVFDNEPLAVKACIDENFCVMPMELNKEYGRESLICLEGYYPMTKLI
jgi:hypothetical protein